MVVHDPKTIEIRHVGGYVSYCGVGGYVSYSDGFQIHDPKTIRIRNVGGYVCNFEWVHLPLSPTPITYPYRSLPLNPLKMRNVGGYVSYFDGFPRPQNPLPKQAFLILACGYIAYCGWRLHGLMDKATFSTPDFSTLRGSNPAIRNGLRNEGYPTTGALK